MPAKASRLRQRLAETAEKRQRQLDIVLEARGPLIRGSFGTRARVCGKPSCRCAAGERHLAKYLAASDGGRMRQVHVPAEGEEHVRAGVERYRLFMSARADLAELGQQQLELVDELGRSLLEPYPRDRPLPPASRFGRRPKRNKSGNGG
jgi:hypothetical protein